MDLNGSVIIVTGSATGLGAAVARGASAKGARVVVNYTKSEAEAKATARACQDLGGDAILCRADVASDETAAAWRTLRWRSGDGSTDW